MMRVVSLFLLLALVDAAAAASAEDGSIDSANSNNSKNNRIQERIVHAKMELWARGAFAFDDDDDDDSHSFFGGDNDESLARSLEGQARLAPLRLGPIRQARRDTLATQQHQQASTPSLWWNQWRGGGVGQGNDDHDNEALLLQKLGARFGPDFIGAIEQNKKDHAEDCRISCESFYCAPADAPLVPLEEVLPPSNSTNKQTPTIASYSFGPVPPDDFADTFGFPLDLIKVTQDTPLFSAEEAARVIESAEAEGVDKNEYKSGKYQLGGDWLVNLPDTRAWFNQRLESTFFPLLAHLFPEVISSPAVLRAHSVSLLKYNSSHPRTDVHIDNGILALTLAMTPQDQYVGGGTFFEHMGVEHVLPMDVGHGTFRPGSVRHGGHRVTEGTRYVLGAFLLLEDKVEHVRRLKNKGSELRRASDLETAVKYFEWALAINPKCTTCLKDWAEILHAQKQFAAAEEKLRRALDLLENKDSDALFTLGIVLSEQGRDDESIEAYQQSVKLNADDAELCYNLGIKLGAQGKAKEEMEMYARAVQADPTFGGAWLNWGTALAERGELDDAEPMFLKAVGCGGEVAPKGMVNLGLLYHAKSNTLAQVSGDLKEAQKYAVKASEFVDLATPLLEELAASSTDNGDVKRYIDQLKPLRIRCHQMIGQLKASQGDMAGCEKEFRLATESFPTDARAWQMLAKILEVQGKTDEAQEITEKVQMIIATTGWQQ